MKETDRIAAIIEGLALLGVDAWMDGDDLYIEGQPGLAVPDDVVFDSHKDHRLAMTWALVGMCLGKKVQVRNMDSVKVSFPEFLGSFEGLVK